MARIQVVGVDAAFSNMGFAIADIDLISKKILVKDIKLVKTESMSGKSVRKSSDDLRRAKQLQAALVANSDHCYVAFVEVPHGSQSARASWSLGIAVGVLSSCPIPIIQVNAEQVKMASIGKKTASKMDIINWAYKLYPDLPWLKSKDRLIQANEHMADAIATLHAGVLTDDFKLAVSMVPNTPTRRVVIK
jgi:Holliday junction resolvasome RuvABC endonuclease subunit